MEQSKIYVSLMSVEINIYMNGRSVGMERANGESRTARARTWNVEENEPSFIPTFLAIAATTVDG